MELFIYTMAIGFIAFPLACSAFPLVRDYAPAQLVIDIVWKYFLKTPPTGVSLLFIKIFCTFYTTWLSMQGAAVVFTLMMFIIVVSVDTCVFLSQEFSPSNFKKKILKFPKCVKRYRMLRIIIRIHDSIVFTFLAVLVAMGIMAIAWGGYVMLVMYHNFPLFIYLCCSTIFCFGITVNFLLVKLAGIPNQNAIKFKQYWRKKLKQREDKLVLNSCIDIGYSLGFVKHVKPSTALKIMDVMISCTVTLVLMKLNDGKSWR